MGMLNADISDVNALSRAKHEAAAWVELIVSGSATTEDYEALLRWRDLCPAHARAYSQAVKLHRFIGARPAQASDHYTPALFERRSTRRVFLGGGLAAAAGLAVVRPPMAMWPSLDEIAADYRTGTGEQRSLALRQGVQIAMNTRTSVKKRTLGDVQGIELIDGEIAVNTDLPVARPFIVLAENRTIIAQNASFNLRRYDQQCTLSCLSGRVTLQYKGGKQELSAAQQIAYTESRIESPKGIDTELVAAWQHGLIVFRNSSLSNVVAEINRYRPGRIVVVSSALAGRRLTGEFRIDRIRDVVEQIQKVTNASVTRLPGEIVLIG